MEIKFDPRSQAERDTALGLIIHMAGHEYVAAIIGATAPTAPTAPTADTPTTPTAPNDPAVAVADQALASPTANPQASTGTIDPQAGVQLDNNGTPWIAEVHATTKTQTAKGIWKAKRGVDKDVIAQVEAEHRAKIANTPAPTIPQTPVVAPEQEPAPVITMEDVSAAWTAGLQAGIVTNEGAMALYGQIGIDPASLSVDETARAKLVNHLNAMMQQPVQTGIPGVPGT